MSFIKKKYLEFFFRQLHLNNIKYIVLRNYQKLPESTGGSDLDILIHKESFKKFNQILKKFVQANSLEFVSYISDRYCPKYCLLDKEWGIQIDIFIGNIKFFGKDLIEENLIWKNVQVYNGINILDPQVASLVSFLKELLNNGYCKTKYVEDLKNNFYFTSIDHALLSNFNHKFIKALNESLSSSGTINFKRLNRLGRANFKKITFTRYKSKVKRFLRNPGYTVAVLGTDGSGKSTIINRITPVLDRAFHNAVYYEHLRPNYLPSLAMLFGNKKQIRGPVKDPHGSSTSGFLGSLFRWLYYVMDYIIGYFLKIWPQKVKCCCVFVFDRYYYDYLIDPKRSRIKLPNWVLKLGQFIIPEPDIILCLGTDPKVIHDRKPELSLTEVERQVSELQNFCASHSSAKWIDTGKNIEESSKEALGSIIKVMAKRFKNIDVKYN